MATTKKTLILIDGHALAFRQFYALERTNMKTSDGTPTWAVFGFFKAIIDLLKNSKLKADAIAVTFDVSRKTFRTAKYEGYKANRDEMPDTMRPQLGLINEGLKAFSIPVYTKEGFEADDVIGTITAKACALGHKTLILTGDQDAFQLVDKDGCVKVIMPSKGELVEYDWNKIHEKLGVYPDQVIDYKALRGDTSDNIPGIRGIGEKTAQTLLSRYKNLDEVLADCENIPEKSVREKICTGKEDAKLSQFLATIVRDVNIEYDFEDSHVVVPDAAMVTEFLKKVQFYSYIKNINEIMGLFNKEGAAAPEHKSAPSQAAQMQLGLFAEPETVKASGDLDFFLKGVKEIASSQAPRNDVVLCAFNIQANVRSALSSEITGISLCYDADKMFHTAEISKLKQFFEDENIKKTTHDLKTAYNVLRNHGIELKGAEFDTVLASYIKNPSRKHDLEVQSLEHLGRFHPENSARLVLELTKYWKENLNEKELKLLHDIEIPLTIVLADMEHTGVSIDVEYLKELTQYMDKMTYKLEARIYKIAGIGFNINSPRQVGEVLFDKLGLRTKKKRMKSQQYSTSADVLEELAQDYEIADLILQYRKFMKLKSTYTESLPVLIDPADGRIHTSYNQTVTTTGRLSSSNPNLQNIPIRSEEGSKIRQAFVPQDRKNSKILSADYSQIELRLLAHISQDKNLIEAFTSGEDVHTLTAARVFDVPVDKVTKEMRYKAKAVNFGIIYGQSKYGLAKALKISNEQADLFINKYFATYPGVKVYMETTTAQVEQQGFVETIFGRRRYLADELHSPTPMIREFAKRAAINQPIQGTAADIMKIAMIDFSKKLKYNKLKSRMIMQVHDEIVVELENSEAQIVKKLITEAMELDQKLSVPLVVDITLGESWKE